MANTDGILGEVEKALTRLKEPAVELGIALNSVMNVAKVVEATVRPFTRVQKEAAELAKSVGLSSKSIMATATRTIEQNRKMQLSMSYNISSPEMIRLQNTMMSKLQRNVAIDQVGTVEKNANGEIVNPNFDSDLENLIAASKVFGEENVGNIVAGFDKLGMSMKSAAKATGKLFQEASEYGINLQKYTENFTSNLEMAQMYNFRNGVDGLKEMARKATEIRQDMRQIASFADKVGNVTGAVETAANLQVLGGSFAALSNPLAMLNESLTDMNGLQDRFSQMTAGAATYNSVTHQIEMDPVTRQIMKRAAESMGVDPKNLIDQAYAQARRSEIDRQINLNGIGGLRDDVLKMLPNIGEIDSKTGVAGATIGGQFRSIGEIAGSVDLQKQLIEETRSESDDIKAIAKSVMTIEDWVSGRQYQAENETARNKIVPGAVGGLSSYEIASKILNEDFNPKLFEAAGRIDLTAEGFYNLKTLIDGKVNPALLEMVDSILHAKNPEQAKADVEQKSKELLGDSDVASTVSSAAGSIASAISNIFGGINEYTVEQANFKLLAGKNNEAFSGQEGREGTITVPEGLNTTQIAGLRTQDFTPNNQVFEEMFRSYLPWYTGTNSNVNIFGNQQSVPGTYVTPTTGRQATGTTQTQPERTNGGYSYSLNLTGNLTMDINGDNGKIGTADLMKMIENDSNFKQELSKAISDTLTKMVEAGMIQNP